MQALTQALTHLTLRKVMFYFCSMHKILIRSHQISMREVILPPLPFTGTRFRRWRGASGASYLVSVYPIAQCPDYVDAVALAVDGRSGACLWVGDTTSAGASLARSLAAARRLGADEVHLHLLASTLEARETAIRDLGEGTAYGHPGSPEPSAPPPSSTPRGHRPGAERTGAWQVPSPSPSRA